MQPNSNGPEVEGPDAMILARQLAEEPPPENPFVGLRPFDTREALLFFGRDAQTTELMQQLHLTRFLSVVGSSGCGKSSLIRAGLIPRLKGGFLLNDRGSWRFAMMKPGMAPLQNLAASLLAAFGEDAGGERLRDFADEIEAAGVVAVTDYLSRRLGGADTSVLLLVDQFEEIFRFGSISEDDPTEDSDEREQRRAEAADFVSIMLALARTGAAPVYVVMTMRSDFLGDCDAFQGLPEAMNKSQYLVPRLTRPQRLEAIQCPPRLRRKAISPELAVRVLEDMGEDPDQLPVMQHALMRTWEKFIETGGEAMSLEHYNATGTLREALSKDADKALEDAGKALVDPNKTPEELKEKGQNIVRLMFQALVETDAKGRRLRRPVSLGDLEAITGESRDTILTIVDCFGKLDNRSFLYVSEDRLGGGLLVDISHESLIRQWGTLGKWVAEEIDSRELYLQLAASAVRREVMGRAALWRDPDLQPALDWWAARRPNAGWAQRYRPKLVLADARRHDPEFVRAEEMHPNPEFVIAEKFLNDSEQRRKEDKDREESERRERENLKRAELENAKRLAEQLQHAAEVEKDRAQEREAAAQLLVQQREATAQKFRWFAFVLLIFSVLAAAAAVYAVNKSREAVREKERAEGLTKQLEKKVESEQKLTELATAQTKEAKRLKGEADDERAKAVARKAEAEESADKALKAQKDAEKARALAVIARQQAEEANTELKGKIIEIKKQQERVESALTAGGDYRNATKARRESRIPVARSLYLRAVAIHKQLGGDENRRAQADNHAELGNMLVKATDEKVVDNFVRTQGVLDGPVDADEVVPEIVNVVLGKVPQAKKDVFDALSFSDTQREGLEFYGQAVESYRALGDLDGSAALVEEVFEFLSPSEENKNTPKPRPSVPSEFVRAQAAVKLFCGTRGDFTGALNQDRHISMLLKIGYRLDAAKSQAEDATQAAKRPDTFELEGCSDSDSEPTAYFDEALKIHESLVSNAAPVEVEEQREKMVNTAVSLGESFLERKDAEQAGRYFEWAKKVYQSAGDDHTQREPRAALLVRIGSIYLKNGDAAPAKGYFEQAEATFPNASDAEQRKALADLLVKIGKVYGRQEDDELSDQQTGFYERAVDLFLRASDHKNAAMTLESVGVKLGLNTVAGSKFLVRAAEEYAKADLLREEADVRVKAGRGLRSMAGRTMNIRLRKEYYQASLTQLEPALAYYVRTGARVEQAAPLPAIATAYLNLGRADEALKAYRDALPLLEDASDHTRGEIYYGIGRAEALKGAARRAEAEAAFEEAKKLYAGYPSDIRNVEAALKRLRDPRPEPTPTLIPPTTEATPSPTPAQAQSANLIKDDAEIGLAGNAIGGQSPKGSAEFTLDGEGEKEFTVTVENVNLPAGTKLDVLVDGKIVGEITLSGDKKRFKLKFEADEDDPVPQIRGGSRVTVVINGQPGRIILAGSFPASASPAPSPALR